MNKHLIVVVIAVLLLAVGLSGCIESNEHEDAQSDGKGDTESYEEEWNPEYGINYTVTVTSVIDGDTFDAIFPDGSEERIRLLGADTPETTASENEENEYDDITDLSCLASYGLEAKDFAESWLDDETIYIQFDSSAGLKGYYGRWLAYVFLVNGTDFGEKLITNGYARVYTEGACSKESYYVTLQNQAMTDRIGLWSCMPEEEPPEEPEQPNISPTASFSYYPSNPTTDDTIQFTDTSTDSDGTITSWSWNFGDGSSSASKNPQHQYSMSGIYTVILEVTDNDGATDSTSKTITVQEEPPEENDLEIIEVNALDEYVVFHNYGESSVIMTGFKLYDDSDYWIPYTFPTGFVLDIGASVTVHTFSGVDTSTDLYWGRGNHIWNNDHDTAYLYDNNYELVDSYSY